MTVDFHSSAVRHLEVVSRDEVVKTLVDAFKGANLGKQTAVILLSDHIVFEKLIPQSEPGVAQKAVARFYHDVPLEEAHIAKKIMPLKGSALALAANRELYQIIIEVAHEFEWKIKAVIPMIPFAKLAEDEQLTPDQVKQILNSDSIFKEADFLNESLLVPEKTKKRDADDEGEGEEKEEESGGKVKNVATALIALFLISIILGSLFYFKILALPFSVPFLSSSPIPSAVPVPEASESGEISESSESAKTQEATVAAEFKREEIRIHVLNGSGIAGQAGKVKEKLTEIGYTNVITGNIESSEASGSSIIYAQDLEESIKSEIGGLMDSIVEGISQTNEAINEFNAVITLGKLESPIE